MNKKTQSNSRNGNIYGWVFKKQTYSLVRTLVKTNAGGSVYREGKPSSPRPGILVLAHLEHKINGSGGGGVRRRRAEDELWDIAARRRRRIAATRVLVCVFEGERAKRSVLSTTGAWALNTCSWVKRLRYTVFVATVILCTSFCACKLRGRLEIDV